MVRWLGRGGESLRNDPPVERNFMSSVQCAGRRHVAKLAHLGEAVPCCAAVVIVVRDEFVRSVVLPGDFGQLIPIAAIVWSQVRV